MRLRTDFEIHEDCRGIRSDLKKF